MKKFLFVFVVFILSLVEFKGQSITPPNVLLTQSEIENKTISELWLLRNSIFAKYGRPFSTYELHAYFMSQPWYKLKQSYKYSDLNTTDLTNIDLLSKEENNRLKNNYITEGNVKKINFDNVYNTFQYPYFSEQEKQLLSKNGFVVVENKSLQLFHIYENNDYLGIPSFITVDAVLQLYHLYFDMTLRTIEEDFLAEKLSILLKRLVIELTTKQKTITNENIKKAIDFDLTYLQVAQYLLSEEPVELLGNTKNITKQEINNCKQASGWSQSPLFGRNFDYSMYIPRGHYTRSESLKRFFMAMMWLGNAGIEIEKNENMLSAVILTSMMYNQTYQNKPLIELWKDIYDVTAFYVGFSDDTGPIEIKKSIDKIFGVNAKIEDFDNGEKLTNLSKSLPEPQIKGSGEWGKQKKQFRMMGQRFVPDSYVFERLTNQKRKVPNSIEIMAALGNKMAKNLMLTDFKSSWLSQIPDYQKILQSLIDENTKRTENQWKQNLYFHWLYNIMALFDAKNNDTLQFFMTTEGWQQKTLNTSLASWAELRHNTVLFVKQTVAAECGGDGYEKQVWIPEPPKGYVEPNILFYDRMLSLIKLTIEGLKSKKMLSYQIEEYGNQIVDILNFLKSISEKEVKKEKISLEEYEQIQKFGSLLDYLTLGIISNGAPYWHLVEGPDKNMPVIVDVHTADDMALEVGVGTAHEIYVVIDVDGKLKLTRGAIFSFYEFLQPSSSRLTDENWQKMIEQGKTPAQPTWIKYKSESKKPKEIKPLYKPKDSQTPDYSTKPGFNTIYYDTGC